MKAHFSACDSYILCKVTSVRHDGDPNQDLPTGMFLADVGVLDGTPDFDTGQKLTLGAKSVFRLKDKACLHDLAKKGEVIVSSRRVQP